MIQGRQRDYYGRIMVKGCLGFSRDCIEVLYFYRRVIMNMDAVIYGNGVVTM